MNNSRSFILSQFGLRVLKPLVFGQGNELGQRDINYPSQDVTAQQAIATSYMGTPIFDRLVFQAGAYETLNGDQVQYDELTIDTVLIEASRPKNIVKTEIAGRDGTIKEYMGLGDWEIDIKGAIISEQAATYPEEEVAKLLELCEAPKALTIQSGFLSLLGVSEIVITDYQLFQKPISNAQLFQISAISDHPFTLRLNADN